jgi:hypothetical protein
VLVVRHARGWGTPGAWIKEKEARERADAEAAAKPAEPTTEASPG